MIKTEQLTINDKQFTKSYSDSGYMIERDGVQYSEAIDPTELGRTYTETDIPIDIESAPIDEEVVQKAKAFDYLTGRSDGNE